MDTATLGTRELDVMTVLWQHTSGTVAEVQEALGTKLAYTTVLTILRNLETKGLVIRESEGRAHRYSPNAKRSAVQRHALKRLIDTVFLGSPEALIAQLASDYNLSPKKLRKIAKRAGGELDVKTKLKAKRKNESSPPEATGQADRSPVAQEDTVFLSETHRGTRPHHAQTHLESS